MISLLVRILIGQGFSESQALRYARIAFLVLVAGALLALVFAVSATIDSCGQKRAEQRIRKAENAVARDTALSNVLAENVNRAKANVNGAEANVNAAKNRPVNRQPVNADEALRRFRCEVEGDCR